MLIVCPTCATSYDVELASLQPSGRQVRCVRCRAVWHAAPRHADKLLAAAEAIGPEPQVAQAPAGAFAEEPALQSADEPPADGGAWAAPDELPSAEPAARSAISRTGAIASAAAISLSAWLGSARQTAWQRTQRT